MPRGTRAGLALIAAVAALSGIAAQPAAAADPVNCTREKDPPAPPKGGAVFARPLQAAPHPTNPNVVVIPAGATWTPTGSCPSADWVMNHPSSIEVGEDGAVLLRGQRAIDFDRSNSVYPGAVAWGARDDKSSPDLDGLNDRLKWRRTTEALSVDPKRLLKDFNSCRDCDLAGVDYRPDRDLELDAAYGNDLSGADLRRATLRGNFGLWHFERANLEGADLSNARFTLVEFNNANLNGARLEHAELINSVLHDTKVDAADFDGANLFGAQLARLRFDSPPSFADVEVGGRPVCTSFSDTDLSRTGLSIRKLSVDREGRGCSKDPLLPGSTAPLSVINQLVKLGAEAKERLNFGRATFVATAADRKDLAGADLSGHTFERASFVGFPASFVKTDFRNVTLKGANFDGADLSGAKFANANLADSSFRDADLAQQGAVHGASFAGPDTDLSGANFIDADISDASFVGANLSGAVFSHVLAEDTNFNGVRAPRSAFTGAHIYGNGRAFDSADNLRGADFNGAVLAGDVDEGGGFNFTHADLAGATFDGAQCIGCNFTRASLTDVNFIGTYLPGAVFTDVASMNAARLNDAWLYCGDRGNSACAASGRSNDRWKWELKLGADEDYGPVPFRQTTLGNAPLSEVQTCPDGKRGDTRPAGCEGESLLPRSQHAPPIPSACSAAGFGACPTPTSTLLDASTPTAVTAVDPANWTTQTGRGTYVAVSDGTIRRLDGGEPRRIAGQAGDLCQGGPCGDGGPAKDARLGEVTGMATGVDGSLYLADSKLHRVRRIDPSGRIETVAGSGRLCVQEPRGDCGNGGQATKASLAGPFGVWVAPGGRIYIADGQLGIREVGNDGQIGAVMSERPDVHSVVGVASGDLYAATDNYIVKLDLEEHRVSRVVGTGTAGYNGNKTVHETLAPGTAVQVNQPTGLSLARNGDVLFADSGNNLIRAYVPSSGHVIDARAGVVANRLPQGGFNGDGHFARETALSNPVAVAARQNGQFVVADAGNNRVRKFGPGPG